MSNIVLSSMQSLFNSLFFANKLLATGTGFVKTTIHGGYLTSNRDHLIGKNQETGKPLSMRCGLYLGFYP